MKSIHIVVWLGVAMALQPVAAENFPTRPIELIINSGPGTTSDTVGRIIAEQLRTSFSVEVRASNIKGANGVAGLNKVRASANDGYTLGTMTTATILGQNDLKLDEFSYVFIAQLSPYVLYVRNESRFTDYQELIDYAKGPVGTIRVATSGKRSVDGLMIALLRAKRFKFKGIPFPDVKARHQALLDGRVDALIDEPGEVLDFLESGKMRSMVVYNKQRIAQFSSVPTSYEYGHEFGLPNWRALVAPANVPVDRLRVLNAAMSHVLAGNPWRLSCAQSVNCTAAHTLEETHALIKKQVDEVLRFVNRYNVNK